MCPFEQELETVIKEFVDESKPFTSMQIRDGIRGQFNMPIRYKETNYEVLSYMQQNASVYKYIVRSIQVVTGQDFLGQDEYTNVWEFVPIKAFYDEIAKSAKVPMPVKDLRPVTAKPSGGGFFSRMFK
jgi:hypothetical protein